MRNNKILWISILQGMTMFCVILGHSVFSFNKGYIWNFCYGFHMPLFIFISGGLLYISRISKEYKTNKVYQDKLLRLGIPYLFFIACAYAFKALLPGSVKNGIDISLYSFIYGYIYPSHSAMKEMWFVGTLLCLMMLYPIFVWSNKSYRREFFVFSIFFFMALLFKTPYQGGGIMNIYGMVRYGIFFYSGILFFKYKIYLHLKKMWIMILFMISYILTSQYRNEYGYIGISVIGIIAFISLALIISDRFPLLFHSFRDYTFQIYLIGIFPQMFIESIYRQHIGNNYLWLICGILSVILGLYVPVIISIFVKKINKIYLNRIFGL